ncbi:unnamed protein product [Lactuca saligna]|uniref:Uncharacterized protein n=1 Tax=Lactuca saligna TaxID=75948 RepID=A0AA35ZCC8_LACSI|nr:unnamed protein product [Lactuca saligna]
MVASAHCLRQSSSSYVELVLIRAKRDELRARLLELEGEKHAFDDLYDLFAWEKASLEEYFLETERVNRENVEADLSWLRKKGIVHVVDMLIESSKFTLGIKQMKATCMEVGVESGKQIIREQVASGKFTPGEMSTLLEYTQAMHVEVKYFLEIDFASYLHFGELDMDGLLLLCSDPDIEGECHEGSTSGTKPSPPAPGM